VTSEIAPAAIRAQLDHRLGDERPTPGGNQRRYLLLLVRPDGIVTYARLLATLGALDVDYGYEFIEQEWVLDFSHDEHGPGSQRWITTGSALEQPHPAEINSPRGAPGPAARLVGNSAPNTRPGGDRGISAQGSGGAPGLTNGLPMAGGATFG